MLLVKGTPTQESVFLFRAVSYTYMYIHIYMNMHIHTHFSFTYTVSVSVRMWRPMFQELGEWDDSKLGKMLGPLPHILWFRVVPMGSHASRQAPKQKPVWANRKLWHWEDWCGSCMANWIISGLVVMYMATDSMNFLGI